MLSANGGQTSAGNRVLQRMRALRELFERLFQGRLWLGPHASAAWNMQKLLQRETAEQRVHEQWQH